MEMDDATIVSAVMQWQRIDCSTSEPGPSIEDAGRRRAGSEMILVTGGAGYIGSHVCIALLDAGIDVVTVDNLSNSNRASLERVQSICGRSLVFRHADIRDEEAIYEILRAYGVTAVIHLAGLKAVGESNVRPMMYYENNVLGTMRLVSAMEKAKVKTLVFSSSATVYGTPAYLPLDEKHPLGPTNPYGRTKLFIEEMLKDFYRSDDDWRIGILRYFNPVGAHESGLIGEDPLGVPNNLLPQCSKTASLFDHLGAREHGRDGGASFLPLKVLRQVAEMLAVRRQLSAEKVAAENASRLLEDAMLRRLSRRRIGRLAGDIDLLDKRMVEIVANDPVLAHRYRLLTSMPGVGSLLACTLIALLPELGCISRKQVAALVGVAPYAFESGTLKGRRCIWGGRANVRQVLYMLEGPPLASRRARSL